MKTPMHLCSSVIIVEVHTVTFTVRLLRMVYLFLLVVGGSRFSALQFSAGNATMQWISSRCNFAQRAQPIEKTEKCIYFWN